MDIEKIAAMFQRPKPYDKGTHVMWTDEYISKQLLVMHTDESHDVASRSRDKIDAIISVIDQQAPKGLDILDLGCGPGLYSERLAKLGHHVTGVDFSERAIAYAKKQAEEKGLDIAYRCQDYLLMNDEVAFDLVLLIYCDFGVLSKEDRAVLIGKIHKALKPGGSLIFDALNKKAVEGLTFGKRWEASKSCGFWREKPYICLSESFLYQEEKATLEQHLVLGDNDEYALYRFWNHFFDLTDIQNLFLAQGFARVATLDLQLNGGPYNDDGVTFYRVRK